MTQALKSPITPEELEQALRELLALLGGADGTAPPPAGIDLVKAKQRAAQLLNAREDERIIMISKRRGLRIGD